MRPGDRGDGLDWATLFAAQAHETKNQLFLLLGGMERIIGEPWLETQPETRHTLASLHQGGTLMAQRLGRLLSLYRIAQGHYQPDIGYHDGAELLEEVVVEARPFLAGSDIHIDADAPSGLYGFFDRELVRGAVLNGLHNALRHGRSAVRLSASREDDYLCFRVEDDGPGFDDDILQGGPEDKATSQGEGGTGLGLRFSATVAALHRKGGRSGSLKLDNGGTLGGAVFSLCLP